VFAAIYRWRLKPGMESQFVDGWERVTREIHKVCGSYGSRLHRCDDGTWLAYARWPDAATRDACEHGETEGRRLMREAVAEDFDDILCDLVTDLLQEPARG
jgi:heme-degrading monooxygenase HmoA